MTLNGAGTSHWKFVGRSVMLVRLNSIVISSETAHIPNRRLDGSDKFGVGNMARKGTVNDPSLVNISMLSATTVFSSGLNVIGKVCEVPEPKTIG